jgi:ribose 5-phosphate isomerase
MGDAMSNNQEKREAGEAAIRYVEDGGIIGVGTGSTVNFFIDALALPRQDQGRGIQLGSSPAIATAQARHSMSSTSTPLAASTSMSMAPTSAIRRSA